MRRRFFLLGVGAILLALVLVLASCDMNTCSAGGDCRIQTNAQGIRTEWIICDRQGGPDGQGGTRPTCRVLRATGTNLDIRCDC